LSVVPWLLPENISVFAFDFSGAGLSDGDYLSLGYYEKADVSTVVDYLKVTAAMCSFCC
jgi:alpha/beta superfamily hydrolase